jgi:hypothetical protein
VRAISGQTKTPHVGFIKPRAAFSDYFFVDAEAAIASFLAAFKRSCLRLRRRIDFFHSFSGHKSISSLLV